MDDFKAFMDWPDQLQYLSKQDLRLAASEREAFPNKSRSFANSIWFIGAQPLAILKPLRDPMLSSRSNSLERTSVPKINKKGERGSPCLSPLSGVQ
jgi:hypothetical protein